MIYRRAGDSHVQARDTGDPGGEEASANTHDIVKTALRQATRKVPGKERAAHSTACLSRRLALVTP